MNDLRKFLAFLKEKHPEEIVEVQAEVDPDYEITAIVKEMEKRTNPVVIFRNPKGSPFRLSSTFWGPGRGWPWPSGLSPKISTRPGTGSCSTR